MRNANSVLMPLLVILSLPSLAQPQLEIVGKRFAVAAFRWDGTPDTNFGNAGKVVTVFPNSKAAGDDRPCHDNPLL